MPFKKTMGKTSQTKYLVATSHGLNFIDEKENAASDWSFIPCDNASKRQITKG